MITDVVLGVVFALAVSAIVIAKSRRHPHQAPQPNAEWTFTIMPAKTTPPVTKKQTQRKTTLRLVRDNQFTITKQDINPTGFCLYSGKSVKDCQCQKHMNIA